MRNELINKIWEKMRINFNIYILTADLWYWVLDELLKEFPERCINIWIAEQNMIWIAAWLALSWKKVFCYSIVPFVTMRCYEQIRIDICSHNLDVTLIWIWGWFAYWTLWNTHYWIEDINIMRWLPNMRIFSPADKIEMKAWLDILLEEKYPTYIRLNRWWEKNIHLSEINNDVDIKKWIELHKWKDIIMFTTWYISSIAIEVAKELMKENISIKVVSIPFLKPLNYENIINIIKWFSHVLSLEEHSIIWWLWSSIAEIIAERNIQTTFKRIGINDTFFYLAWNQEYMRELAGIDKKSIINIVKSVL
jgi:transketolase